jgi:hypothetical protein
MTTNELCECLWTCGRGRTRLACQLRQHADHDVRLEVLRNNRAYGMYRFSGRSPALVFAARLRHCFEGNGWIAD